MLRSTVGPRSVSAAQCQSAGPAARVPRPRSARRAPARARAPLDGLDFEIISHKDIFNITSSHKDTFNSEFPKLAAPSEPGRALRAGAGLPRDDGAAPRATAAGTLDPTARGRDSRNWIRARIL